MRQFRGGQPPRNRAPVRGYAGIPPLPPLLNSHFFGVINLTSLEGGSIETGSVYTRCVKLNMAVAVFSGFGLVHEASLEKPKVSLLSIDNNL